MIVSSFRGCKSKVFNTVAITLSSLCTKVLITHIVKPEHLLLATTNGDPKPLKIMSETLNMNKIKNCCVPT